MKKRNYSLIALLTLFALSGCSVGGNDPINNNEKNSTSSIIENGSIVISANEEVSDAESSYVEIDSDFTITSSDGTYSSSVVDNHTIYTITSAGEYTLSGKLNEGQIYVNAPEEKVVLILNGVSLNASFDSPIYVLDADKVTIRSEENTYNEINDTRAVKESDEETLGAGAIYAACDMLLNGTGSLNITGTYNNGVHCKDDLDIKDVTLKVKAVNNAIKGNDSITIKSGSIIAISTGGDALKTENSGLSSKGNQKGTVTISGGSVSLYAACDGIDSAYDVDISDEASVNIYTDKYSSYTGETFSVTTSDVYLSVPSNYYSTSYRYAAYLYNSDTDYTWVDAEFYKSVTTQDFRNSKTSYYYTLSMPSSYTNMILCRFSSSETENSLETYSASDGGGTINKDKNLYSISYISQSSNKITASWGTYSESGESSTKGIKADNSISISGGSIAIQSVDDCLHVNNDVALENGETPLGSISITGGTLSLASLDDGIHADNSITIDDGTIDVETSYEGIEAPTITFNGGTTYVYATDDGINAAGGSTNAVYVNGGYLDVVVASGDTDGIDSNGNYYQTGGFVITRDKTTDTSGNASGLDIDGSAIITGGTIIMVGSVAETPASSSTNNWVRFGSSSGGMGGMGGFGGGGRPGSSSSSSGLSFTAGNYSIANTTITFTLDASYNNMWISSSEFTLNSSYTLTNGTTSYSWTQSSKSVTVNS